MRDRRCADPRPGARAATGPAADRDARADDRAGPGLGGGGGLRGRAAGWLPQVLVPRRRRPRAGVEVVDWAAVAAEVGATSTSFGAPPCSPVRPGNGATSRPVACGSSPRARTWRSSRASACRPTSAASTAYRPPGYLGVGHTRMATESAVTTDDSHPFLTHDDIASCTTGASPTTSPCGVTSRVRASAASPTTTPRWLLASSAARWTHGRGPARRAGRCCRRRWTASSRWSARPATQMAVVRDEFGCKPAMVAVERPVRRRGLGVPRAGGAAGHRRRRGVRADADGDLLVGPVAMSRS